MKKIIALALALVLCLSLAACAGGSNNQIKIAAQKGTTSFMYGQVLKGVDCVSYDTLHWLPTT